MELPPPHVLEQFMELCPVKGTMSAGAGFALGGVFGLFISSMDFTNYSAATFTASDGSQRTINDLPFRQQVREAFKDMGKRSYSMAKNFGTVGAVYATTECIIEGYRAKHDTVNSVSAGCITGGILAAKSGPTNAAFGCAAFAAFSAAIDYFTEGKF